MMTVIILGLHVIVYTSCDHCKAEPRHQPPGQQSPHQHWLVCHVWVSPVKPPDLVTNPGVLKIIYLTSHFIISLLLSFRCMLLSSFNV